MDTCFTIHMFLFLFLVSPMCTLPWSDQSQALTPWSGTYYSFPSDEPYALFLVGHSYSTCMYLPFAKEEPQPIAYMSFPQNSELALMPCITSHLPRTISHWITLPHNPTVFTLYHTWRQSLTPRSHPQSPKGLILRSLAA